MLCGGGGGVVFATHLRAIHCSYSVLPSAISSRQEVTLHNAAERERHGVPFLSSSSSSRCFLNPQFPHLIVALSSPFPASFHHRHPLLLPTFSHDPPPSLPPAALRCPLLSPPFSITSPFKNSAKTRYGAAADNHCLHCLANTTFSSLRQHLQTASLFDK